MALGAGREAAARLGHALPVTSVPNLAAQADERPPAGAGAAGWRLAAGGPELPLSERDRTRVSGLPGLGRATWGRLTWLGTLESPLSKPGHHELGLICLWLTAL